LCAAERLRGEKELSRALDEARRAAGQYDKLPEAHKLLGDLYRQTGDKEAARREYQRFLELSPPHLKEMEEVRSLLATL
jgi:Flp pilus assembly protein TadD